MGRPSKTIALQPGEPAPAASPAASPAAAAPTAAGLRFNTAPGAPGSKQTLVSVVLEAPSAAERRPVDIICVVDVSGSMCSGVGVAEGGEDDNLTRLDLTKHSVRTVAAALKPQDRLAVITFSNEAKTVLPLTEMTAANRTQAAATVNGLSTEGATMLWKGIEAGLTLAAETSAAAEAPAEAGAAAAAAGKSLAARRAKFEKTVPSGGKASKPDSQPGVAATHCRTHGAAQPEPEPAAGGGGRTTVVMVLTDGQPSDQDHRRQLESFLGAHPGLLSRVSVSTFGFGYSLDSPLLDAVAHRCGGTSGGMYTFIPDASIVGTAFVNALSNALATAHQGVELELEAAPGYRVAAVHGGHFMPRESAVLIGPVLFGQDRSLVVTVEQDRGEAPAASAATPLLSATATAGGGGLRLRGAAVAGAAGEAASAVFAAKHRLEFGPKVAAAMAAGATSAAADAIADFVAEIKASPATAAALASTEALVQDLEGQVSEALSRHDWLSKWGKHYLPSLARAHLLQQCTNFKDPGVQQYGGPIFKAEQEACDDIFVSLPPPTPSGSGRRSGGGHSAPIDMSRYYNSGGGCFAGSCSVAMAGGGLKRVDQLRRGDRVRAAGGAPAAVRCVVRSRCADGEARLVPLPGGALLTEYHPVRRPSGGWAFPRDLAPSCTVATTHVFNLVLEAGHTVTIDGVEAVTLGHGFTDEVARHPYFGSMQRVASDLARHPGWADDGLVALEPDAFLRSAATNRVCGIRAPTRPSKLSKHDMVLVNLSSAVAGGELVAVTIERPSVDSKFGFSIADHNGRGSFRGGEAKYVYRVKPGTPADGLVLPDDELVSLAGRNATDMSQDQISRLLSQAASLQIRVRRQKQYAAAAADAATAAESVATAAPPPAAALALRAKL